jgi:hypothetical protein
LSKSKKGANDDPLVPIDGKYKYKKAMPIQKIKKNYKDLVDLLR